MQNQYLESNFNPDMVARLQQLYFKEFLLSNQPQSPVLKVTHPIFTASPLTDSITKLRYSVNS